MRLAYRPHNIHSYYYYKSCRFYVQFEYSMREIKGLTKLSPNITIIVDRYDGAYKAILLLYISFIFILIKFSYFYSCLIFVMKSMGKFNV